MGSPASSRSLILACAASRATIMGPVSDRRVLTAQPLRIFRISSIGFVRSISTTSSAKSCVCTSGMYLAGFISNCSMKIPSLVILPSACRSAEQDTPKTDRHAGAMAGQAYDAHVMAEVFAAELRADPHLARQVENLFFHFQVSKGLAKLVAMGRQAVQIPRTDQLDRLEIELRRCAADHDCQVIGRTGGRAQRADFFIQESDHFFFVKHGRRLLIQKCFVGRSAALGDKQELVCVAAGGIDVNLRRQVVAGISLPGTSTAERRWNSAGCVPDRFSAHHPISRPRHCPSPRHSGPFCP